MSDTKTRAEGGKLLRATAQSFAADVGWYDAGCIYGNAGGMSTNGGCCCLKEAPREARRPLQVLSRAAKQLAEEVIALREQVR